MKECIINFSLFNWWAVIVATLAGYLLGAFWYSNAIFGKAWAKIQDLTDDDLKKGWLQAMLITFITTFLTAVALQVLIIGVGVKLPAQAVMLGTMIGLFIVAGNMLSENLYSRRPLKFWFISAGYRFFMIIIMTLIMGFWL